MYRGTEVEELGLSFLSANGFLAFSTHVSSSLWFNFLCLTVQLAVEKQAVWELLFLTRSMIRGVSGCVISTMYSIAWCWAHRTLALLVSRLLSSWDTPNLNLISANNQIFYFTFIPSNEKSSRLVLNYHWVKNNQETQECVEYSSSSVLITRKSNVFSLWISNMSWRHESHEMSVTELLHSGSTSQDSQLTGCFDFPILQPTRNAQWVFFLPF